MQNRITRAIADDSRVAIEKTVPARAKAAIDAGEVSGGTVLSSVGLHFSLTDAQKADLEQLLADQQNPSSPHYHEWLTPAQYGARFGLSDADLGKVQSWVKAQGLSVTYTSPSRNFIYVSGTVSQIDQALATSIHNVVENGVSHISNLVDPALPSAMASVVNGISGLNDFKPKARARVSIVRDPSVQPKFTSSISGNHYVAPGDIYTIYNSKPLLNSSINGNGIKIAIAGQTDISTSDVAAFRSASGLSSTAPTIVQVPGYRAGIITADLDEAQLDVEWSGASAPNATIVYVTVGSAQNLSVMDALTYAITNNVAPIISISYGGCESAWGQSSLTTYNTYFQQANAQGITIVGPSGDSGATDCDYNVATATQGLAVDFPSSSPYVTGAGGTMFNEGSGSYWSSSNDSYGGSALSYIPEAVWNESDSSGLSATGGGVSAYFAKPTWQVGTGVPSDSARDVPDIALNAAASHDGYLFCSQGSCTNGFRNSANNLNVVGGTSVSSPVFAGMIALLEQRLGTTSGLGNVNPMIYGLANSSYASSVFHDVTSGNNNSTCRQGTTNCPSGGAIGYSANTGYDLTTGWGSVDAYNMVMSWGLVNPAGYVPSSGAADFSLALASSSVTVKSGSSATATINLGSLNNFSGNITVSATPGSTMAGTTVSFSPTNPITVSAAGTASTTLTITTTKSGTTARLHDPSPLNWNNTAPGVAIACVLLLAIPRRRVAISLLALVMTVGMMTTLGCGGGTSTSTSSGSSNSSGSGGASTTTTGTVAGTYTVTVSATSGSTVHTTPLTVTVTN